MNEVKNGVIINSEDLLTEELAMEEEKSITQFKNDYREYALYTIIHRALPDIRDGLKPVHRRILYSMAKLGCRFTSTTMKSARIVGDVIGKYHPHGDTSVYEAMVIMAQFWSLRYPIVHGQGNFGSIDGDSPAAMRYSEAKLSKVGELCLGKELNMGAVAFEDNYDSKMQEPTVLPVEVPYLILNGGSGIAVGIASDFMPHNFTEVMNACSSVLKKRSGMYATTSVENLVMKHITGPDFPTGGTMIAPEGALKEAYRTGRGLVSLRAKIEIEQLPRGEWQLVVTELPFGVKKEPFIVDIANYINMQYESKSSKNGKKSTSTSKKATIGLLIDDISDETDKNDIRIVIKPRSKSMDPEALILHMYSVTDLQVTIKINMNALVENRSRPKQVSIFECIERFLDFRENVIIKASKFRLEKVNSRLHILIGLTIAISNIDNVIKIIRTEDNPEDVLMKTYDLSEIQVESIIDMRLKRLKKLGMDDIIKEKHSLEEESEFLNKLIHNDKFRFDHMINRFKELIKLFGDDRKTIIEVGSTKAKTMDATSTVPKEPATVLVTSKGWVKHIKGKDADTSKTKLIEGDSIAQTFNTYTNNNIVFIGESGKAYSMVVASLPSGRTEGKHVGAFFEMGADKIINSFPVDNEEFYLLVSDIGYAISIKGENFVSAMKKGKQMLTTGGKVSNFFIYQIKELESLFALVYTSDNKIALISLKDIPVLPKGKGNKLISLTKGATLKGVSIAHIHENKVLVNQEDINVSKDLILIERGRVCKKIDTRIFNRLAKAFFV